ncbi:MAG: carbon storage regulator CsrA [Syntrophaceae bacterium]
MLILTRKLGEAIKIGDQVTIYFLEVKGKQVRIGIEAPPHITIHRQEVYESIRQENIRAAETLPLQSGGPALEDFRKLITKGAKGTKS